MAARQPRTLEKPWTGRGGGREVRLDRAGPGRMDEGGEPGSPGQRGFGPRRLCNGAIAVHGRLQGLRQIRPVRGANNVVRHFWRFCRRAAAIAPHRPTGTPLPGAPNQQPMHADETVVRPFPSGHAGDASRTRESHRDGPFAFDATVLADMSGTVIRRRDADTMLVSGRNKSQAPRLRRGRRGCQSGDSSPPSSALACWVFSRASATSLSFTIRFASRRPPRTPPACRTPRRSRFRPLKPRRWLRRKPRPPRNRPSLPPSRRGPRRQSRPNTPATGQTTVEAPLGDMRPELPPRTLVTPKRVTKRGEGATDLSAAAVGKCASGRAIPSAEHA